MFGGKEVLARQKASNPSEHRFPSEAIRKRKVVYDRFDVEGRPPVEDQCFQLGGKRDLPSNFVIVERFHPQSVAREEQTLVPLIPERECEHPDHFSEEVVAAHITHRQRVGTASPNGCRGTDGKRPCRDPSAAGRGRLQSRTSKPSRSAEAFRERQRQFRPGRRGLTAESYGGHAGAPRRPFG